MAVLFSFSFQLKFPTVTSSLFLISILRTVSTFNVCVLWAYACLCQNIWLSVYKVHRSDVFFNCFSIRHWSVNGLSQPSSRLWTVGLLVNSAKVCTSWESEDESGGQISDCESARGLGRDTVTRWCYSNLFGRQSCTRPNEPVIMKSIWMPALCAAVIHLHAFEKLNGYGPGNQ